MTVQIVGRYDVRIGHLALVALLVLLALVTCSLTAAGPGQAPFEPYFRDDNGASHGGGGEGSGGGGGGGSM